MENGAQCPKFFNENFLKSALEDGFNRTDVRVLDFNINLASVGGENYCSDIYRVKVDYVFEEDENTVTREIHLILKDMKSDVEEDMVVKSKETAMYKEVIPEMEKILRGKEILAPKLFTAVKYDCEVYVFQDLNALGYELKDRIVGLSEKDCIIVLKKIAKFHAASMVFAEKFPEIVDKVKDHMFQFGIKGSALMESHMVGMIRSASEAVGSWEGYQSIADKVYKISEVFDEKTMNACNRANCRYKVINHGDLWVNNFLFKDDDLAFIDLQLANYGSPAIDINYFLYTSVPVDILKSKRYELLRIYFKQFQVTLKSIEYEKIPSWEDFQYEMRRMEFAGVWTLLTILPLITLCKDDSKGTNVETLKDVEAFAAKKRIMFGTKRVEETFKYALDRFNDVRALD